MPVSSVVPEASNSTASGAGPLRRVACNAATGVPEAVDVGAGAGAGAGGLALVGLVEFVAGGRLVGFAAGAVVASKPAATA